MKGSEKIKGILAEIKMKPAAFAKAIGLKAAQNVYDIQRDRVNISKDVAYKIIEVFPRFELDWLLYGKGAMLKPEFAAEQSDVFTFVPLLPISAQGGSLDDFVVSVKGSECERVVSPVKGADFALTVSGDSMAPEYPSGSQILIKKINERAFIKWGEAYVLDTCNGTVIKLIVPSEKKGFIKCVSINPDKKYAPFEVALEDVYGIYRVLMCMAIK